MTYQKFCDIEYDTEKERDYHCWNLVNLTHSRPETGEKYRYYMNKMQRINKFKREVLTKALAELPNDFFDK